MDEAIVGCTRKAANLLAEPNHRAQVVGKVKAGLELPLIKAEGNFYRLFGQSMYIHFAQVVVLEKEAQKT